ncbi:n-6 adenine-specific DNA methyltransferase 2 [Grosmannia clavigera kw1407]|uniref:Protein-lysine N-methyltransferase EFM5 n=1 Tax=Grosmannia clavigera (strain kw1407 / UAMH 11150) TaxID=655863 RepID=F0XR95_GROCL|nr:n-6 adenine-specific DNA methyltransferase 2 [Grosmannia clavigera kw1407]EFW99757.1 n-6 adenine-specific DNA methyltransferase 2 [Grosmannia clavigera kw1407]
MATDSDDELTLSASAMDALRAFYSERDDHVKRFADLQSAADAAAEEKPVVLSMDTFTEDWNKSQFWYSDDTAQLLARQLIQGTDASSSIVVISAPSVFVALKNLVSALPSDERPGLLLLEHDDRFTVFGSEYIFYDFNKPTKLPRSAALRASADRIVCDPPFLSQDCQTKAALTVRWLSKPTARVAVSTGERMESLVTDKLYRAQGVRTTSFVPLHAHGLGNDFCCYANFEGDEWTWLAKKAKP